MKSKEYIQLARRTIDEDMTHDDYLIMLTLGLVGEVNELYNEIGKSNSRDNIIKECGDVYWYLYNFMCWINGYAETDKVDPFYTLLDKSYLDRTDILVSSKKLSTGLCSDISRLTATICEMIKKYKFHCHSLDFNRVFELLDNVDMLLRMILINQGITRDEVLVANIEKLKKRYPDGFKSTDSIERKE